MNESHDVSAAAAIQRIEELVGTTLPAKYRSFLSAQLPWDERRRFIRLPEGDPRKSVELADIYHYAVVRRTPFKKGAVKNVTIEFVLGVFKDRKPGEGIIPSGAMAVASCTTGEEVLLFVRGTRAGQVWLKDWQGVGEQVVEDPEGGLRKLGQDFGEFLETLRLSE